MVTAARKKIIDEINNILNMVDEDTLLSIRDNALLEFEHLKEESLTEEEVEKVLAKKKESLNKFLEIINNAPYNLPVDYDYKEDYANYLVKKYESLP